MFKTGNVIIDSFSKGIILLPLLPACIIFLRKIYQQETLNFLMILCLLSYGEKLGQLIPGLKEGHHSIIKNIFSLLELVMITQIFRSGLAGKIKEAMNMFLIAILSVFITYFIMEGTDRRSVELDAAQNSIIILLAIPGLSLLIRSNNLYIFHSPFFWFVIGTLFCFLIVVLVEMVGRGYLELPNAADTDKMAFINIATLIRYLFYTMATLVYQPDMKKEEQPWV